MYQQDANSFTTINETTMLNYFFTFHYFTKACYIKDFKLYKLFDSNKYYSEDWDALKYPEL